MMCVNYLSIKQGKNVSLNKWKAESRRDKSIGPPDVMMQKVKERDEKDYRFHFSFHWRKELGRFSLQAISWSLWFRNSSLRSKWQRHALTWLGEIHSTIWKTLYFQHILPLSNSVLVLLLGWVLAAAAKTNIDSSPQPKLKQPYCKYGTTFYGL